MKKLFIVLGIIVLLSIYNTAFSLGEEKNFIDFPEADYEKGESFIYGSILKVDYENRKLIIKQHMDHNSQRVSPILRVREDVVIVLKRNNKAMNIDFSDLKIEDSFGLVLDESNMVRGIIIFV
ncbi:MAG: hypothetical protein GX069_04270 [Tissierellia bacterium]|nr:hypothetical protein [Tissierellia bacterium]